MVNLHVYFWVKRRTIINTDLLILVIISFIKIIENWSFVLSFYTSLVNDYEIRLCNGHKLLIFKDTCERIVGFWISVSLFIYIDV